jgi:hypothetical protein
MFIVTEKYTDPVMALAIHAVKRLDENEKKKGFVLLSAFVLCFGGFKTEPSFFTGYFYCVSASMHIVK